MKRLSLRAHSLTFLGVIACGGETLDLGSNRSSVAGTAGSAANGGAGATSQGGNAGSTVSGAPLPAWPDPLACTLPEPLPMGGSWQGYFQGEPPVFWPDTFRLDFSGATTNASPCGVVTFGDEEPPAPAADPETMYPPASTGFPEGGIGGSPGSWGPLPGFPYTMLEVSKESRRLLFRLSLAELWRGWCALQTPLARAWANDFGCVYPWVVRESMQCTHGNPGAEPTPIDCGQAMLCSSGVCACNETGCAAEPASYPATFDLHFDDDVAMGVLADHAVVLERID